MLHHSSPQLQGLFQRSGGEKKTPHSTHTTNQLLWESGNGEKKNPKTRAGPEKEGEIIGTQIRIEEDSSRRMDVNAHGLIRSERMIEEPEGRSFSLPAVQSKRINAWQLAVDVSALCSDGWVCDALRADSVSLVVKQLEKTQTHHKENKMKDHRRADDATAHTSPLKEAGTLVKWGKKTPGGESSPAVYSLLNNYFPAFLIAVHFLNYLRVEPQVGLINRWM